MATLFTEIYDLAMVEIRDYQLDQLYVSSVPDFNSFMAGFLNRAIPKFDYCLKDLTDRDLTQFNPTLNDKEKDILATLLSISWFTSKVQDVTQFQLHLNDTDFKHYAEGQNLKEKSVHLDKLREKVKQDMTDYGLTNTDWTVYGNGDFS